MKPLYQEDQSKKQLWESARKKIWNLEFTKKPQEMAELSKEEKDLVKDLVSEGSDPKQISQLMSQFATSLCEKMIAQEDVIKLIAWVHQQLISIHPFHDGNGRTARLFMNVIGMWMGQSPFLIPDSKAYIEAARSLSSEKFADYLRDLLGQQVKLSQFTNDCLRHLFNNSCKNYNCDSLCNKVRKISIENTIKSVSELK
jgi:hypothetical protein